MIYLKEGHVVGMGLPLHPDIEARWRNGHLTRVHADGSAWQDSDGDPFAVLSGEANLGQRRAPTTTPRRPPASKSRRLASHQAGSRRTARKTSHRGRAATHRVRHGRTTPSLSAS